MCLATERLKFLEVPDNATLHLGSSESIVCRADGKTRPRVRWYRDGQSAMPEHVSQTRDGSLYFNVVESGDAGVYVCVATNDEGSINATVRVDVVGECNPYSVASPAMGHWGTCPPRLPTISFLVHFGVNLRANYPSIV